MTNRRVDAIYFVLIIAVAAIGYVAANRFSETGEILSLPDYSPAPLVFDVPFEPFELPFQRVNFERALPPTLALSSTMESALVEVRAALLESSTMVEVPRPRGLLASRE
jgi:hypothetical protein